MLIKFAIPAIDYSLAEALEAELDAKTKPLASLGRLEQLAIQIGLVQQTLLPAIRKPGMLVFAGDHGSAKAQISPYPQSVTAAMVKNFANGGAAINVLTRQLGWNLQLINSGTLDDIPLPQIRDRRIGPGTRNFLEAPAMTASELEQAIQAGAHEIHQLAHQGCNTIGLGEMGIGNSSSAALLIHCLCDISLIDAVSRGAGCNDSQLAHKLAMLEAALRLHGRQTDPWEALRIYGGFELAMIAGAALAAAEQGMLILVDGLIASSAVMVALKAYPELKPYLIFGHQSAAQGHRELLCSLGVQPLLQLDMRLGEGTGAALALPLVQSAAAILSEMATFASAELEGRVEG